MLDLQSVFRAFIHEGEAIFIDEGKLFPHTAVKAGIRIKALCKRVSALTVCGGQLQRIMSVISL